MNLILLQLEDFIEILERKQQDQHGDNKQSSDNVADEENDNGKLIEVVGTAVVTDERRVNHIHTVLKSEVGDVLKVGQLNGWLGKGTILSMDLTQVRLAVSLTEPPTKPSEVTLILALPEPKDIFLKIIHHATVLGVKRFYIINATNVPIGYWGAQTTQRNAIRDMLLLGLEQTIDTTLPEVHLRRDTKTFLNLELPQIMKGATNLIIARQPSEMVDVPHRRLDESGPINLLIGPQSNFTVAEEKKLSDELGFERVTMGRRVIPVLTMVNIMLGRLSL